MRGIIIRRTIDDFTTSLVSCQSAVLRIHTVDPDPTLWQNADPKPEQNEKIGLRPPDPDEKIYILTHILVVIQGVW